MNDGSKAENPNLDWIGSVRSGWRVMRLKWTVRGSKGGVWGDEPDGMNDIVCVRVADFDRTANRVLLNDPTLRAVPASQRNGRMLQYGDLLLEKSGGGEHQPVGTVVLYDHTEAAVCSNFVARLPVADGFNSTFLCYLHAALYALKINVRSIKQTTGIQNLDSASYLDEQVAIPPIEEQRAIAEFLDRKTAAIDEVIRDKERMVELLQEQRRSIISEIVVKGIDPSLPMKESGVSWLGKVPAHWEVQRVKWLADVESGHTPDKKVNAYWTDCDIPWVSLNDSKFLRENDYISA